MPDAWMTLNLLAATLLSFAGVGLATLIARRLELVALPGIRQSHVLPTPTGGGLGMVAALVILSLVPGFSSHYPEIWRWSVVPALAVLGITGWLDDRSHLSVILRLFIQLAVSLTLLVSLHVFGITPAQGLPFWVSGLIILVMMWLMNAYNFMDGSNGMAGAQGVFAGLVLGLVLLHGESPGLASCAFAVAGVSLGFLPWNIPRARVFMGDAGSVPMGMALGSLLLIGIAIESIALAVALLVLGTFLVDSTLTLLKRFIRGERWYTPHKKHVYQKMIATGWSHGRVLTLYQAFNVFLVLPGVVLGVLYPGIAWLLTGTVYLVLITAWGFGSLKNRGQL